MKQGLDVEKAKEAFKRAAYKATHGTREERSGRFLPKSSNSACTTGARGAANIGHSRKSDSHS